MKRSTERLLAVLIIAALAALLVFGHHATKTSTRAFAPAQVTPAQSCPGDQATMQCVLQHQAPPASTAKSLSKPLGVPSGDLLGSAFSLSAATTSEYGVDFGWSTLSATGLRAIGARFAASYFSPDASKNWTAAAVNADHAAGIATVGVWESTAARAEGGYAAGVSDAESARAQAAAVGNTSRPVFFAIDCDCAGASILSYFQGAHSVLGSRTGAYGGYDQVLYLHNHGLISVGWQTYAWSGGRWLPASIAPLEQYLNGNAFDNDRAISANYGQWPYATAKPAPASIGGAQHYERYPANAPARPNRERPSVQGWDDGNGSRRRCENPVRRPSCKLTRAHLAYDLRRDQTLYHRDSKATRNTLRLPGRIQGLVHRLDGRGIVKGWL